MVQPRASVFEGFFGHWHRGSDVFRASVLVYSKLSKKVSE